MKELEGQVTLVTGGSRGIGLAIAQELARSGAVVAVVARNGEAAEAAAASLEGSGPKGYACDVSEAAGVKVMVAELEEELGPVDILVNNAGITRDNIFIRTTEEDWDRIMAINAKGVFLGTKQAIPAMRESGGGSIVNISSTAGLVGSPYSGASYAATKGAVRLFTKATAIQYAKEGIRCNSVHPGLLETPMTQDMLADAAHREERTQRIPLGRVGTAEDVAYGVLYLASDEASFVTGSELVIDGGATAQ